MRKYFCCNERRRVAVLESLTLNGVDYLEVVDSPADPPDLRQRVLLVRFLKPLAAGSLSAKNFRVEGGERISDISVLQADLAASSSPPPPADSPAARTVRLLVSVAGDFSLYTLRVVVDASSSEPLPSMDPLLSAVDFSFKVACPSDFDCLEDKLARLGSARRPRSTTWRRTTAPSAS